jgi:hypothetical protein
MTVATMISKGILTHPMSQIISFVHFSASVDMWLVIAPVEEDFLLPGERTSALR